LGISERHDSTRLGRPTLLPARGSFPVRKAGYAKGHRGQGEWLPVEPKSLGGSPPLFQAACPNAGYVFEPRGGDRDGARRAEDPRLRPCPSGRSPFCQDGAHPSFSRIWEASQATRTGRRSLPAALSGRSPRAIKAVGLPTSFTAWTRDGEVLVTEELAPVDHFVTPRRRRRDRRRHYRRVEPPPVTRFSGPRLAFVVWVRERKTRRRTHDSASTPFEQAQCVGLHQKSPSRAILSASGLPDKMLLRFVVQPFAARRGPRRDGFEQGTSKRFTCQARPRGIRPSSNRVVARRPRSRSGRSPGEGRCGHE